MTVVFAIVLVVHGLIHLLGFAKAFGLADLPQLTQPISPLLGVLWLIAAFLFLAAAGSLFVWPRWWWAIGACAIVVSMVAIVPSWTRCEVRRPRQSHRARRRGLRLPGSGTNQPAGSVRARRGSRARARRTSGADRGCGPRASPCSRAAVSPHDRRRRAAARPQLSRTPARPHPEWSRSTMDAARRRAVQRHRRARAVCST